MKICVFGAGAIGGMLGVLLARAGQQVSLVARGAHLEAMQRDGARLLIDGEERVARLPCTDDARDLGPQDLILLTLKARSLPASVESIVPLLGPDTAIVTGTNGIPYWFFDRFGGPLEGAVLDSIDPGGRQMQRFGAQRAIGCVLNPAAELIAPGLIRHVHGRKFPIGEPDGRTTGRLVQLQQAMQAAGLEAPIRADIRDEIWLKLWGNLCLSPISALTHATLDRLVADPDVRAICLAMMEEARQVGECFGARLRVDAHRRLEGAASVGAHKISMLLDVEHRRALEIDPIVTVVQEISRRVRVPTPTIDIVAALIRLRERELLCRTNPARGRAGDPPRLSRVRRQPANPD
jgi:2-dehydropantoate 2-reductase